MEIKFNGNTFYNRQDYDNNLQRINILQKLEVQALQARNYRLHEQIIIEKLFILKQQ